VTAAKVKVIAASRKSKGALAPTTSPPAWAMLQVELGWRVWSRMTRLPTGQGPPNRHWEKEMSFVITQPEVLTAAAGQLAVIGSAMTASNSAVAQPTTGLVPAAADEVSALTVAAFTAHGALYQEVSAQAAAMHQLFVATLQASAASYAATEAANAAGAR